MSIKLHLSTAESEPVERTAKAFGCEPEDILYVALDEYMTRLGGHFEEACGAECRKTYADFESVKAQILNTKAARKDNLPIWADSAASVYPYEGKPDLEPEKSDASRF